jgi:hypothetical protein
LAEIGGEIRIELFQRGTPSIALKQAENLQILRASEDKK